MEKENKYYEVIENLIKTHKKFPGLEPIIENIIDDVYSHSEVIISTVNNDAVVNAYLAKVVSTSIITVPKRMNFHNAIKPHVTVSTVMPEIKPEVTKVDNSLVDKMINSSEKTEVIIPTEEEKELVIDEVTQPEIIEEVTVEPLEEKEEIVPENEPEQLIEEINLGEYEVESESKAEAEAEIEDEQPLLFEEKTELEEISDSVLEQDVQEELVLEESLLLEEPKEEKELLLEEPDATIEEIIEGHEQVEPTFTEDIVNLEENYIEELPEKNLETSLEFEEETLEETEVEEILEPENVLEESLAILEEEAPEELILETEDKQDEIIAEVDELPEVSEDDLSLDFDIQEEALETTEEPLLVEESAQQDELLPEEDTFEVIEDNSITLDTFSNDDDLTEFMIEEPQELELSSETNESTEGVNFVATDYSKFEFTPDKTESEQSFDVDLIVKELTELDNKKPELSILEIYNLKYKDNMPVSEISSKLDISENRVIEALNEIIAVL